MSNSIVDYVFRALGLEYLNRTDLVQVPPNDDFSEKTETVELSRSCACSKKSDNSLSRIEPVEFIQKLM